MLWKCSCNVVEVLLSQAVHPRAKN
uniref:Uncharacterized protein n=1 Tax=Anguilla anguilla TaxID=7936 RepID=A0A0E9SYS8_ANGAN